MSDRRDHRHAEQRHRSAQRLVAEAEQVGERAAPAGDDHHVDLGHGGQVPEGSRDRRRGVAVLHRREAPHEASRPAASGQACEDVVASLACLAGDDADRARDERPREELLQLEQALRVELLAQAVDAREQVSLAGDPQVAHGEREAGGGGGAAGVVVTAARYDHLHPLRRGAAGAGDHRLPSSPPCGAGDRAGRVAQLKVHARRRGAQVHELADELHAGERAQLGTQCGGVLADRKRSRERAVGDARPPGGERWLGRGHCTPA